MDVTSMTTLSILNAPAKFPGVHIGRVIDVREGGRVMVDFPENPFGPAVARLTKSVSTKDALAAIESNAQVMLTFEDGDPSAPILFDVVSPQESGQLGRDESPVPQFSDIEPQAATAAPTNTEQGPREFLIGKICGIREGLVEVRINGDEERRRAARTTVRLRDLTSDVLVAVPANGEPVIIGQLYGSAVMEQSGSSDADVVLRGNRIRIEAECDVTLKAGNCEIQLDARGKATTVADQVVSRARGVNKVQGGCVQLN